MPAFLAGPLLKYAIMVLIVAALCGTIYVYHLKLAAADAEVSVAHSKINELNDQVTEFQHTNSQQKDVIDKLTTDAQQYEAAAVKAKADLQVFMSERDSDVAQAQQQIRTVAVASDRVVSPALARLSRIWLSTGTGSSATANSAGSAAH